MKVRATIFDHHICNLSLLLTIIDQHARSHNRCFLNTSSVISTLVQVEINSKLESFVHHVRFLEMHITLGEETAYLHQHKTR